MTEPILQSALSTVVGVSLLAFVPSYIVRTFVWTVFAVVGIGLLHGLLFVPVLLELMVGCYSVVGGDDVSRKSLVAGASD